MGASWQERRLGRGLRGRRRRKHDDTRNERGSASNEGDGRHVAGGEAFVAQRDPFVVAEVALWAVRFSVALLRQRAKPECRTDADADEAKGAKNDAERPLSATTRVRR